MRSMELPPQPEAEKMSVKEQLLSLNGATIKDMEIAPDSKALKGKDVFMIEVGDKETFLSKEELAKMSGSFGEIVFNEFEPKQNPRTFDANNPDMVNETAELVEFNVCHSDRIIVVSEGDKMIGFFAVELLPMKDGSQAAYVALTMVDHRQQNQGYAKEMYNLAFEQKDVSAFVGLSFVPQAVNNRLKVGRENGYEGFFCGHKNGIYGDKGTPEEQEKIKELNQMMVDKSKKEDVTIEGEMPENYVVWQKEMAMDPIKPEDVNFSSDNPLAEVYEKDVLPTQAKYSPDVVYGVLINLKKQAEA